MDLATLTDLGTTQEALEAAIRILDPNRGTLIGSHIMYTYEHEGGLRARSNDKIVRESLLYASEIAKGPILALTLSAVSGGESQVLLIVIEGNRCIFCPSGLCGAHVPATHVSRYRLKEV